MSLVNTFFANNDGGGGDVTVTVSGVQAGDVLSVVAFCFSNVPGTAIETPTDNQGNTYFERQEVALDATFRTNAAIFDCVVGGTPPTSVTVAQSAGTVDDLHAVVHVLRGNSYETSNKVTNAAASNPALPATSLFASAGIGIAGISHDGASTTLTPPGSWGVTQEDESRAYSVASLTLSAFGAVSGSWTTGAARDYSQVIGLYRDTSFPAYIHKDLPYKGDDQSPLASRGWIAYSGWPALVERDTNRMRGASNDYWSTIFDDMKWANFEVEFEIVSLNPGDEFFEVQTRIQDTSPTLSTWSGYSFVILDADTWEINRMTAGTGTQIGAGTATIGTGSTIGVSCKGYVFEFWHKPSGGSWTLVAMGVDTTYRNGGRIAISSFGTSNVLSFPSIGYSSEVAARIHQLRPVAYWKFDEPIGTYASNEIGNAPGTYDGSLAIGQPALPATDEIGRSIEPDNSLGDGVAMGDTFPFNGTQVFSAMAFARLDAFNAGSGHWLFSREGTTAHGWAVWRNTADDYYFARGDASSLDTIITLGSATAVGNTDLVCATYGYDAEMRLYVNARQAVQGTSTKSVVESPTGDFKIGKYWGGGSGWDGGIDDACLFDRPLTDVEQSFVMGTADGDFPLGDVWYPSAQTDDVDPAGGFTGFTPSTIATIRSKASVLTGSFVTASDNFNRANETPLGGNWVRRSGSTNNINLSSNQLVSSGDGDKLYSYSPLALSGLSQYSQITLLSSNLNADIGPCVRIGGAGGFDAYLISLFTGSLAKIVGGAFTQLGTANVLDPYITGGAVFRVEVFYDQLYAYVDGVLRQQVTDTSITGAGVGVGVFIYDNSEPLDNWAGGIGTWSAATYEELLTAPCQFAVRSEWGIGGGGVQEINYLVQADDDGGVPVPDGDRQGYQIYTNFPGVDDITVNRMDGGGVQVEKMSLPVLSISNGDSLGVTVDVDGTHTVYRKPVAQPWEVVGSFTDTTYTEGYVSLHTDGFGSATWDSFGGASIPYEAPPEQPDIVFPMRMF